MFKRLGQFQFLMFALSVVLYFMWPQYRSLIRAKRHLNATYATFCMSTELKDAPSLLAAAHARALREVLAIEEEAR